MIKRDINFKLLRENLNYLYVRELKSYCLRLSLSEKGKKAALISRIVHFIKTGERIDNPKYPAASCSKGIVVDLNPASLMLKGSYRNDLKSRLFFKKLIG
ncbi:MAG: SAP domain-containing protein, partial [Rickettsiaceae bacterium]|nr:SAP domain-containing protein [Rickettsiaceae bacterium]